MCVCVLEIFGVLTVLPFPGGRVDVAKELKCSDGFGVEVHPQWLAARDSICLVQRSQNLALPCKSRTERYGGVEDEWSCVPVPAFPMTNTE